MVSPYTSTTGSPTEPSWEERRIMMGGSGTDNHHNYTLKPEHNYTLSTTTLWEGIL